MWIHGVLSQGCVRTQPLLLLSSLHFFGATFPLFHSSQLRGLQFWSRVSALLWKRSGISNCHSNKAWAILEVTARDWKKRACCINEAMHSWSASRRIRHSPWQGVAKLLQFLSVLQKQLQFLNVTVTVLFQFPDTSLRVLSFAIGTYRNCKRLPGSSFDAHLLPGNGPWNETLRVRCVRYDSHLLLGHRSFCDCHYWSDIDDRPVGDENSAEKNKNKHKHKHNNNKKQ